MGSKWIDWGVRGIAVLAFAIFLVRGQWTVLPWLLPILPATWSVDLLCRCLRLEKAKGVQNLVSIHTLLALLPGSALEFYNRVPWWDDFLHLFSGLYLGGLGYILLNRFLVEKIREDVSFHHLAGLVFYTMFVTSLAGGALWEIYEFSVDRLLGFNCQNWMAGWDFALRDTMLDLVWDGIGAVLSGVYGVYLAKSGHILKSIPPKVHR